MSMLHVQILKHFPHIPCNSLPPSPTKSRPTTNQKVAREWDSPDSSKKLMCNRYTRRCIIVCNKACSKQCLFYKQKRCPLDEPLAEFCIDRNVFLSSQVHYSPQHSDLSARLGNDGEIECQKLRRMSLGWQMAKLT